LKVIGIPKETAYELNERNKELSCIYEVSDLLIQSDIKYDEMMDQILYLIQSAMEFPHLINVLIRVKDKEYKSQNFKKSVWQITNKVIEDENDLSIEVYSMEDKHFATEKIHLIEDIAFKLKIFLDHLFQNNLAHNLAKQKLIDSEEKYKELFNHMTSGVAMYDALDGATDFIIKDINKAGEKIDKISKKEVIDKKVTEAFPGVKDFGLFDVFKRVWKTGIPENHPISLYKDDRVSHWVENYVYKLSTGEIIAIYDDVTAKKKAEQKIKKSEEKYRILVENAQEGIWAIDENGNTTYVNIKMGEILGYSVEEMIGRSLFFFMDEEGKKLANHYFERRKQGIKEPHEFQFIKRNRERVYTRLETAPLINEKGEFYGALACVADITDYHQAEEKLKQSEKKFKSIFIDSPIGIELYDSEGKLEDINGACLDIFGALDINSVKGFDLFQDPNVSEDVKKELLAGETVRYESEFDFTKVKELNLYETSKSGIIDLDILITPLYQSGTNSISNYLVQVQDITERNQAEFALKESEEKFRMTFEQAAVGIAHVAPDGRFLRVNQKWCNIVGYTPEEMITRTFQEITHPDDLDADLEFVKQMLDKEISNYSMEKRYFNKDGSIVWINLTVALLFEVTGEPKYFISAIEDITYKKSTELALQISKEKYAKLAQKLEVDLKETEFLAETLMERLPCIAILLRPQTREIVASNKYAKEVGAVPGKTCYGTWRQREDTCPWCLAPKALETGKIQHMVVDALDVVWDAYWVPIKEDLYLHYAFDITEQKQAEIKIKESEARYKNLSNEVEMILDHIPALVFYKDTQNRFLRVNKYVADAYNLSKDELVGKSLFDLYPQEEAQAYWDDDLEVIKNGKPKLNFEEPWDTVEGKKWVSTSKIPFINEEGIITGIIGFSNDITERMVMEQKLKESEEKFSKAFHASPTLMAITRMEDGYFLDVNKTYTQVLGYSREELIGHTSLELDLWVNQEQRSEFTKRLKEHKRIDAFDVDVYT